MALKTALLIALTSASEAKSDQQLLCWFLPFTEITCGLCFAHNPIDLIKGHLKHL